MNDIQKYNFCFKFDFITFHFMEFSLKDLKYKLQKWLFRI